MNSQKSLKIKFLFIAVLALSFIIAVGAFLGITLARADRSVTISGTSTFITANKAEVWAHREGDEENPVDHTMFVFNDNKDAVNYRKNLAFKWIENSAKQAEAPKTEEGKEEATETAKPDISFDKQYGWFNLEIGFGDPTNNAEYEVEYKYFVITFESQQYYQTKDGKSTNYIVFAPAEDKNLNVYITHKETEDEDLNAVLDKIADLTSIGTVKADQHITINFTADYDGNEESLTNLEGGDYLVKISDEDNHCYGKFENVGKTYAKYSSSTTTPVTPLSFEAVFEKEDENETEAHGRAFMTLYYLNNQSFKLKDTRAVEQHRAGGTVNDDTPPVLCLDKSVPFIKYNGEITFDYTVIDVLTSSPSLTTSYYMLTDKDANPDTGKAPVYNEDGGDYKKVTDSDNQYIFPHAKHYLPKTSDYGKKIADKTFEVKAAVKVVLKLTDTTSTGGQTTYVLLDWFVDDGYLLTVNGEKYIAVTEDKQGATYAYTDTAAKTSNPDMTGDNANTEWKKIVDDYQKKVTEAAKDLKAGSKNYFYLPSAEDLFTDNATPYEDLEFSIYYNNGSQQQSTGKKANALSINLTKSGKYVFTVYAKDAAGNSMYYFDGEEETELETSDIWNMYNQKKDSDYEGMKKYLPWFEFTVEASEISIEDPDEQSTAYVGSSFTPDSFEINGVSVKTEYNLYEFHNDDYAKDHGGVAMKYEDFAKNVETLLKDSRQYFTRIRPTNDLKEGTADYEAFNDYGWNGSSLSFTPQTANAFYVIKCEARSSEIAEPETSYMTIAAATKVEPLKGEDTWVQDNVTSIILLCIAGASLIGIILLLVIKPKNKVDIDEVIEAPKKKTKKN
ncbi:MAG: hypothetical protein K2O28_03075 [Clostridia bacterium]|nr:hypothetical protein [Clostridia bacterium]